MSEFTDPLDGETNSSLLVNRVPLVAVPYELVSFVNGTLMDSLTGAGKVNRKRWCTQWVKHPDAVHRLAAIYDQWLFLLAGGKNAPSLHDFIRDCVDYHMPMLTDPDYGVFSQCDVDGHEQHKRIDDAARKKDTAEVGAAVSTAPYGA